MARKKLISVSSNYDDVWDTMEELTTEGKNVSEYACKSMRFYKKYKDTINTELTEDRVREIFIEEFQKLNIQATEVKNDKEVLKINDVLSNEAFQEAFDSFDSDIENL